MVHKMRLVNFAFMAIKKGTKDIEVRLNDEKRQLIHIGDLIEFTNIDTSKKLVVKVIDLYKFDNFSDLFNSFNYTRLGLNKDDDASIMDNFYTKEEQDKYRALGIEIELLRDFISN